jgi:IS605 OrfB family transposase
VTLRRGLRFSLAAPLPPALFSLLADYRLLTNEVLRQALITGSTAKGSLSRFARDRAFVHRLTGQHAIVASEIALSLAASHRSRVRQGWHPRVPYIRQRFLRADASTFHFDPDSGRVRLSMRYGEWCSFSIQASAYHRAALAAPGVKIKQLHIGEHGASLVLERPPPTTYAPRALIALDTNESSLDGISVSPEANQCVRVSFPEVRSIQHTHFVRRRFLARKKTHDRRVGRMLLRREGKREHNRVDFRLHALTRRLVETAVRSQAAIALEDLTGLSSRATFGRRTHRRLSSWPRGELHRQIEYKAAELGVPIIRVAPYRTSSTCPKCGVYTKPRRRVAPVFTCSACGWRMDRQLNAGVNIGRTALRSSTELGGLRLDLDALSRDAMRPRYPFEKSRGQGPSGRKGRDRLSRAGEGRS